MDQFGLDSAVVPVVGAMTGEVCCCTGVVNLVIQESGVEPWCLSCVIRVRAVAASWVTWVQNLVAGVVCAVLA
ncbi:MAG: hypothetical protein ACK56F_06420, partial [bacterium]